MENLAALPKARKRASIVLVDDEQPILTELEIILCRIYNVQTFSNPELVKGKEKFPSY